MSRPGDDNPDGYPPIYLLALVGFPPEACKGDRPTWREFWAWKDDPGKVPPRWDKSSLTMDGEEVGRIEEPKRTLN